MRTDNLRLRAAIDQAVAGLGALAAGDRVSRTALLSVAAALRQAADVPSVYGGDPEIRAHLAQKS